MEVEKLTGGRVLDLAKQDGAAVTHDGVELPKLVPGICLGDRLAELVMGTIGWGLMIPAQQEPQSIGRL